MMDRQCGWCQKQFTGDEQLCADAHMLFHSDCHAKFILYCRFVKAFARQPNWSEMVLLTNIVGRGQMPQPQELALILSPQATAAA